MKEEPLLGLLLKALAKHGYKSQEVADILKKAEDDPEMYALMESAVDLRKAFEEEKPIKPKPLARFLVSNSFLIPATICFWLFAFICYLLGTSAFVFSSAAISTGCMWLIAKLLDV